MSLNKVGSAFKQENNLRRLAGEWLINACNAHTSTERSHIFDPINLFYRSEFFYTVEACVCVWINGAEYLGFRNHVANIGRNFNVGGWQLALSVFTRDLRPRACSLLITEKGKGGEKEGEDSSNTFQRCHDFRVNLCSGIIFSFHCVAVLS